MWAEDIYTGVFLRLGGVPTATRHNQMKYCLWIDAVVFHGLPIAQMQSSFDQPHGMQLRAICRKTDSGSEGLILGRFHVQAR
jgi:hypothetical protein